jgi:hypothetical protein
LIDQQRYNQTFWTAIERSCRVVKHSDCTKMLTTKRRRGTIRHNLYIGYYICQGNASGKLYVRRRQDLAGKFDNSLRKMGRFITICCYEPLRYPFGVNSFYTEHGVAFGFGEHGGFTIQTMHKRKGNLLDIPSTIWGRKFSGSPEKRALLCALKQGTSREWLLANDLNELCLKSCCICYYMAKIDCFNEIWLVVFWYIWPQKRIPGYGSEKHTDLWGRHWPAAGGLCHELVRYSQPKPEPADAD